MTGSGGFGGAVGILGRAGVQGSQQERDPQAESGPGERLRVGRSVAVNQQMEKNSFHERHRIAAPLSAALHKHTHAQTLCIWLDPQMYLILNKR